ncbi:hypothetical protein [Halapricum hydrolyticum]|uniref:Uncharacterized protein n=1 Tax=Halapricum hydrolyticum TaxID=2979991 RepID=A0AAE3LGB4_9EURY|nr:hypothetical protein [Halapricum hydrolyticum]MCU4716981.1 hypothetical protein [Halapricum hydrolyticum]MCU4725414.1 hypothetical protein [Halapricum hydrolyticum]
MTADDLKRRFWEWLAAVHSDARVAALLRALSIVGIYGGITAFVLGVNPILTPHVLEAVKYSGNTVGLIGMIGLLVHVASLGYYLATKPKHLENGLIRY